MNNSVKTSRYQLNSYSRYWWLMLVLLFVLAVLFYFIDIIKVSNIYRIQFSDSKVDLLNEIKSKSILTKNLFFDFGFIIAYTLLFWFSIKIFDLTLSLKLNKKIYYLVLLPGLCDVLENICLFSLLKTFDSSVFFVFWSCVRIKWIVLIPFILINLIIILYYIVVFFGNKISESINSKNIKRTY